MYWLVSIILYYHQFYIHCHISSRAVLETTRHMQRSSIVNVITVQNFGHYGRRCRRHHRFIVRLDENR